MEYIGLQEISGLHRQQITLRQWTCLHQRTNCVYNKLNYYSDITDEVSTDYNLSTDDDDAEV